MDVYNVQNINNEGDICLHRTQKGAEDCLKTKKKYNTREKYEIVEENATEGAYNDLDED